MREPKELPEEAPSDHQLRKKESYTIDKDGTMS